MSTITINKAKAGKRIAYAMEESGLTDDILAARLGVDESEVRLWKNGETYPPIEVVISISDITDIPATYFMPVIRGIPNT